MLALILTIIPSGRASCVQTGTISGRVADESGYGVPHAGVLLKGTPKGAAADAEGNFRIVEVPVGGYTVVAKAIGYTRSERSDVQVIAGQTTTVEFRLTAVPVRLSKVDIICTPIRKPIDDRPFSAPSEDSLALFGTWRWSESRGGELGIRTTPVSAGLDRLLYFREDGTYGLWERGSGRDTLLCAGTFAVHRSGGRLHEDGARVSLWVEFRGWYVSFEARQLIAFRGRDTIMTYPGGGNMIVSDANTDTYVREVGRSGVRLGR